MGSACTGSLLIQKERTRAGDSWQGDDPDPVAVTREPVLKVAAVAGVMEAPACYKDKVEFMRVGDGNPPSRSCPGSRIAQ